LKWWKLRHEEIDFAGEKWTQDIEAHRKYSLNWVYGRGQPGLGRDCVHFGGNSGYQAINLAYLWGAKRIVLLGFDCKDVQGKAHWFGQHPAQLNRVQPYQIWINHFNQLATELEIEGVEVINCSPGTALTCFRQQDISEL